jgi:hypothetical protein
MEVLSIIRARRASFIRPKKICGKKGGIFITMTKPQMKGLQEKYHICLAGNVLI